MRSMSGHFDRVRNMSIVMIKDIHIYEEHKALVNALKNSQKDQALKILKDHLTKFKIHKDELKNLHPEYFV